MKPWSTRAQLVRMLSAWVQVSASVERRFVYKGAAERIPAQSGSVKFGVWFEDILCYCDVGICVKVSPFEWPFGQLPTDICPFQNFIFIINFVTLWSVLSEIEVIWDYFEYSKISSSVISNRTKTMYLHLWFFNVVFNMHRKISQSILSLHVSLGNIIEWQMLFAVLQHATR